MADPSDDDEKLNLHGLSTADYIKAEALLSVDQKSALAVRLATGLNARDANIDDSASAEAILRLIIWNAEPAVVESMAQAAADNPNTPHSLAWALANDDEAAAMPILAVSIALSDDDLVAIVSSTQSFAKMGAIAVRPAVSSDLSRSLARHGDENTAHLLLNNTRAEISEDAYVSMINRHGEHTRIQEGIINRDVISASVAERLSSVVGEALAAKLSERHPTVMKAPLAIPQGNMEGLSAGEMDALVTRMAAERSISAPLLVRKLCIGNFQFFCRALSVMTKEPTYDVFPKILESPEAYLPEL